MPDRTVLLRADTGDRRRAGARPLRFADLRPVRIRGRRLPGSDRRRLRQDRRRRTRQDRRRGCGRYRRGGARAGAGGAGDLSERPEPSDRGGAGARRCPARSPRPRPSSPRSARRWRRRSATGPRTPTSSSARPEAARRRWPARSRRRCWRPDADDPADAGRRALLDPSPHPDLTWLRPPGNQHLVEEVRREVIGAISYRPFEGGRRVFVIEAADAMAEESQNALLKTLEEPPGLRPPDPDHRGARRAARHRAQPLHGDPLRAAAARVAAAPPRRRAAGAEATRNSRRWRCSPAATSGAPACSARRPASGCASYSESSARAALVRSARRATVGRPDQARRREREAARLGGRRRGLRARRGIRQGARRHEGQARGRGGGEAGRPPRPDGGHRPQPRAGRRTGSPTSRRSPRARRRRSATAIAAANSMPTPAAPIRSGRGVRPSLRWTRAGASG